ncbi:MAG: DUF971 domain-containing protein [Pseudomonadota bacterium]
MTNETGVPWPIELRLKKSDRILEVDFDNGRAVRLTAERLRVDSPSAEVQGHHPSQKKVVTGKQNVAIVDMERVGNYAVRLIFDDGHDTGLYTWAYLYDLGAD